MERPTWNEYFVDLAVLIASRSTCLRKQHGAIVVKNRQILTTGYNGVPIGAEHCSTCIRIEQNIPHGERYELCKSVHAEMNSIIQAARHGVSIEGADIYITGMPCMMCARAIINAGLKHVFVAELDSQQYHADSINLLSKAKIPIVKVGE